MLQFFYVATNVISIPRLDFTHLVDGNQIIFRRYRLSLTNIVTYTTNWRKQTPLREGGELSYKNKNKK